ncbi:MAG: hypothetical protein JNM68_07115, partial [Dinghuibacter sp.]|nr:hypothetical protein [Dinghuibacter sp.]
VKEFVGTPMLSTMDIFRYSNLQIGGRVILLALEKNNFRLQFEAGAKLLRNRLFVDTLRAGPDSGKVADDLRPVHSFITMIDLYGKTLLSKKDDIRLEFNAGIMWVTLKDSYYEQFDAAVKDAYDRATVLLPVNKAGINRNSRPISYVNLRLNKDWGENKTNAAFFRVNYYYQTGTWQKNMRGGNDPLPPVFVDSKFHNHYLQLQLGLALDVKKLFNLKAQGEGEKADKPVDSPISN